MLAWRRSRKMNSFETDVLKINVLYLSPDKTPKLCSGGINFISPVPEQSGVTLAKF